MGIKYFCTWLYKNFPECLINAPIMDRIFIDLNGPIHNTCQRVYNYSNGASAFQTWGPNATVNTVASLLRVLILKLVTDLRVVKSTFIAIDGIAPRAKQVQQRGRRMQTERINNFDPNCITAGTEYMLEISNLLKKYSLLDVVISGTEIPGEGEHKCFSELKRIRSKYDKCGIVGIDSDLIIISLFLDIPRLYIIRDDDCIDIDLLKKNLKKKLDVPPKIFAVLTFFCGNDFLPPMYKIINGGLDALIKTWKLLGSKPLIKIFNNKPRISVSNLKKIMKFTNFPKEPILVIDESSLLSNYIKTFQWIFLYYSIQVPSWNWYYPHHNIPNIDDEKRPNLNFTLDEPCDAITQFLRILPAQSNSLVPKEFREKLKSLPQNYTVIGEGWDSIIITDFIDV